jgi:hypothetical protein
LFQYVQHVEIPMSFAGLAIEDATDAEAEGRSRSDRGDFPSVGSFA